MLADQPSVIAIVCAHMGGMRNLQDGGQALQSAQQYGDLSKASQLGDEGRLERLLFVDYIRHKVKLCRGSCLARPCSAASISRSNC